MISTFKKTAIMDATRKFRSAGQFCISPTRFFVHESNFDEYRDAFVATAEKSVVGNANGANRQ